MACSRATVQDQQALATVASIGRPEQGNASRSGVSRAAGLRYRQRQGTDSRSAGREIRVRADFPTHFGEQRGHAVEVFHAHEFVR